MYHYDPETALEELRDDVVLPHPVHLRDMILRTKLDPAKALELNRDFQEYLAQFGGAQKPRERDSRTARRGRAQSILTLRVLPGTMLFCCACRRQERRGNGLWLGKPS